jgi:Zn-dependent protease
METKMFGIDVKVHWSWWIFVLMFSFSDIIALDASRILFDLFLAAALMGTITMHELAHALEARKYGADTHSIHLHILGGVALIQPTRMFTPIEDFKIAFAGPLSNFIALVPLILLGTTTGFSIFYWAAGINLMLGAFNLIPAYPLDGGRIARAGFQMAGMSNNNAVNLSQNVAVFFGILFILVGLYIGGGGLALIGVLILAAIWWEKKGNRV